MTTLTHSKYGHGTLISEENGKVTIEFKEGVKILIVKFARLLNEDGTSFEGTTGDVVIEAKANKYQKSGSKKLNKANFMSKEEYAKSKYSTISNDDFADEREADKWGSKSF